MKGSDSNMGTFPIPDAVPAWDRQGMKNQITACAVLAVFVAALAGCAAPTGGPSGTPTAAGVSTSTYEDGAQLVFEWYGSGGDGKKLFLVNGETDRHTTITEDVAAGTEHVHPDWSPDGTKIAFESLAHEGAASIWIAEADGSNAVETISCESPNCLQQFQPSFSPDGQSLVFVQGDGPADHWGPASIVTLELNTGTRQVVAATADGKAAFYNPRWSPDGTQIVAQYETYPDIEESDILSSEIVVVPSDGSAPPTSLTDPTMFAGHPDWSWKNNLIVFDTYDLSAFFPVSPGDSNLYVMNPDGSDQRQLTATTLSKLQRIGEPTWTPDGTSIVASIGSLNSDGVIQNASIIFVDPASGEFDRIGASGACARLQPVLS
ncbi:hypothetical protein BH11ACT3_BH11ACT3_25700 [soil metagenome]